MIYDCLITHPSVKFEFSRIRSNTTMVSCTEKPITVNRAVRKSESACQPSRCR